MKYLQLFVIKSEVIIDMILTLIYYIDIVLFYYDKFIFIFLAYRRYHSEVSLSSVRNFPKHLLAAGILSVCIFSQV